VLTFDLTFDSVLVLYDNANANEYQYQYQHINMHHIYTHQDLYNDIFAVINGIQNFVPYFQGVGFA
jgi:hypothetical protein